MKAKIEKAGGTAVPRGQDPEASHRWGTLLLGGSLLQTDVGKKRIYACPYLLCNIRHASPVQESRSASAFRPSVQSESQSACRGRRWQPGAGVIWLPALSMRARWSGVSEEVNFGGEPLSGRWPQSESRGCTGRFPCSADRLGCKGYRSFAPYAECASIGSPDSSITCPRANLAIITFSNRIYSIVHSDQRIE